MRWGRYEISSFNFGMFRLDGGAMFGSVPKNIWSKKIAADAENCIPLATRSLLIKDDNRTILIDVGMGEKWNDKQRHIFAIQNTPRSNWPFQVEAISDIILTHLHFDHAGGISEWQQPGSTQIKLTYPKAVIHIQRDNLVNARNPNLKERASYLPENVSALDLATTNLLSGRREVFPDIWVQQVDGHTRGQQYIEILNGSRKLIFTTDLIPTSHHIAIPFHMGYDTCASTILNEKEALLSQICGSDSLLVFQHDPQICAATVGKDSKGHYKIENVSSI